MLRISWQTLRARRGTLAGAFVAIWIAVTLAYGTGLLMAAALGPPGPGRFAAADAVLTSPRLDADLVARAAALDGVQRAVGDVSFPAGAWDARGARLSADPLYAHGWASAALTPYALTAGRAPSGAREVVADTRLGVGPGARVRVATPAGEAAYRVTGLVSGAAGPPALFFADRVAARLSGSPDTVNAIVIAGHVPANAIPGVTVLGRAHASAADAADPRAADRETLIAIFGTMGGIAGMVALFVVAGTFTLAIVQRRREVAVLRALGAAPHQVRRLIAGEALIVSVLAGGLGLLAGRPLANAIVSILADHDTIPAGFAPGHSWIPLVAAFGGGILIAQLAVFAAARRAGRTRPADALREAAIEHARPGVLQLLVGVLCLGGGVAMALVFSGMWAVAFAILEGLLLAAGVGLLGRALLGLPAAALARPLRRLGASGLLASTSLSANRWRTAALATPVMLVAMLAGTQGIVQSSGQRDVERVTAARTLAPHVLVGRDGAPLPPDVTRLDDATSLRATTVEPEAPALAEDGPWPAAGLGVRGAPALDLGFTQGSLRDVSGDAVAVSAVFAHAGHLRVGDAFAVRVAGRRRTLQVAGIYDRAAGLGDVVLARVDAPVSAVFVAHRPSESPRAVQALTRDEYRRTVTADGNEQAWAVWMIIGLAALFAGLALVNTAAMATAERREELATIRLLGGTRGQAARTVALETLPTVLVALVAGAAVTAVSVHGIPDGLTGMPLAIPVPLLAGIAVGAAALGLVAALVTTRLQGVRT